MRGAAVRHRVGSQGKRRRSHNAIALLVAPLLAVGCAPPDTPARGDTESPGEAEVRATRAAFNQAIAERDLDFIASLHLDEYVLIAGHRGQWIGADAANEVWAGILDDPTEVYVRRTRDVHVNEAWGLAEETGDWNGRYTAGGEPATASGVYTAKWRRAFDGSWRLESEVFTTLACNGNAEACTPPEEPPIRVGNIDVYALAPDLFRLRMTDADGWTNALLLRSAEGSVLVDHLGNWQTLEPDATTADNLPRVLEHLDAPAPTTVIDTHWHGDHTGANTTWPEAEVVAHENVRARLSTRQTPWWWPDGIGPMAAAGLPDRTFADSLALEFDADRVHLWNFGIAHSDGDAVVYFEASDVVHMGDLYHGLNDASVGDDMRGLANTLSETLSRIGPETVVVTGHGDLSTADDMRAYRDMLLAAIDDVESRVAAGSSLEEVLSAPLPAPWVGTLPDDQVGPWYREIYRTLTGR